MYQDKFITVDQALALVKSDDHIVTGLGAAEGRAFLSQLHTIHDRVKNVVLWNCLPMMGYEFYMNPEYRYSFGVEGWFYNGDLRRNHKNGNISFIPNHLHLAATKRLAWRNPDIYIGSASMPDKHGYISLSLSNTYEKRMIEAAKISILEVNPNFPRTFGDVQVHVSEIDYLIQADYEVPVLPDVPSNDKDRMIGNFIAERVNDGDCIQLGIGGIPNAVADALVHKKDLGVHTEMMTSGIMKLAKLGVINGSKKQQHQGKIVATFIMGTKELYEFVDDNPSIAIFDGHYTNDPAIIGLNDNQISINTTLEIDLTGQCASESIGSTQFSGTGGQSDTAVGAQNSKNGRSFIALYSTAMVKNPETGEREEISKIVPSLKPGAAVSLSRNDVDYVVTEYGVAALRGTSIRERVDLLINIAHPKFREQLRKDALALGLIYEK